MKLTGGWRLRNALCAEKGLSGWAVAPWSSEECALATRVLLESFQWESVCRMRGVATDSCNRRYEQSITVTRECYRNMAEFRSDLGSPTSLFPLIGVDMPHYAP